ncbi:vesicular glutamate transporter 3-like [Myzus persicae]|uniref:vesicular glutamate transporter 3-like n=1 Tax=Myzus persicae TaxID=13164 RepID=UPI000B936401|nr:vesicular glutamate transporter 3-like [Myzus persicae]
MFIGLFILQYQCQSVILVLMKSYKEFTDAYFVYGIIVGYIPGGVLATVYPAHNIFGISFIVSYIYILMEFINKEFFLNAHLHHFFQFCTGTTLGIACVATRRVCTFWMPLSKQSLRYVPILLQSITILYIELYDTQIYYIAKKRTGLIVKVGLAWFVLWLYVINGDGCQNPNRGFILFRLFRDSTTVSSSSRISFVALRRSIISDIPWKSFLTSMPVIALVLSSMCYGIVSASKYDEYNYDMTLDKPFREHTITMLLLLIVLAEIFPEITVCFSVTKVRKLFNCTIFIVTGVIFLLVTFKVKTFLFLETEELFKFIF